MYLLGVESTLPKWLESLLPSGARTRFSHVCIDTPAERLQTPFGKSVLNENNKRILSVRGDWEDIRYSAVWMHNDQNNTIARIFVHGDRLWTPNDSQWRQRKLPEWLWDGQHWPMARESSILVTLFKSRTLPEEEEDNPDPNLVVEQNSGKEVDQQEHASDRDESDRSSTTADPPKYSLYDLFSEDPDDLDEADVAQCFAGACLDQRTKEDWATAIEKGATFLHSSTPFRVDENGSRKHWKYETQDDCSLNPDDELTGTPLDQVGDCPSGYLGSVEGSGEPESMPVFSNGMSYHEIEAIFDAYQAAKIKALAATRIARNHLRSRSGSDCSDWNRHASHTSEVATNLARCEDPESGKVPWSRKPVQQRRSNELQPTTTVNPIRQHLTPVSVSHNRRETAAEFADVKGLPMDAPDRDSQPEAGINAALGEAYTYRGQPYSEVRNANVAKPQQTPTRILPPCDDSIKHDDHAPNTRPDCTTCQENAMRDHKHSTTEKPILRLGGFAIDLVERVSSDNLVQTCMVGVSVDKRENVRKIFISIPMRGKTKSDLRKALMQLLLRAEYVFGASPITRIHGDRESALQALHEDLGRLAIVTTSTPGNDSKGNAYAENAIAQLTSKARISLGNALQHLDEKEKIRVGNLLWGHAMAHAADQESIEQAEEHGGSDPPDMRPSLLLRKDILPFGCEVLFRKGGRVKADRVEAPGLKAYYLGPHHLTPKGSRLLYLGRTYHVETDSATVRPVKNHENFKYCRHFPKKASCRPAIGQSDPFFTWMQCTHCKKFRCVPTSLQGFLDEWNVPFQCSFDVDDEGVAKSCRDPEVTYDENGEVGSAQHKKGQKQTKKHAGMAPRKAGRKLGQKDTKPRKKYTRRATQAAAPIAAVGQYTTTLHDGLTLPTTEIDRTASHSDSRQCPSVNKPVRDTSGSNLHQRVNAPTSPLPTPTAVDDDEEALPPLDHEQLHKQWADMSSFQKADAHVDASAAFGRMCRTLNLEPDMIRNRDCAAFHALLDWFSSEEAIWMDEENERGSAEMKESVELGTPVWEKYRSGDRKGEDAQHVALSEMLHADQLKERVEKDMWQAYHKDYRNAVREVERLRYECHLSAKNCGRCPAMYVYQALKLKDAKSREKYHETVSSEVGRMLEFSCWGKPIGRSFIPDHAWVYRVNMLYGIKNVEIPEKAKDKARLVLMGNLRFTKSGKLLLDRWFRSPGEFWAPASSMAGLRFVACVAVILGLPLETIDLDAAYLQTEVKQQDDYLQLTPEIIEGLPDDWRAAVKAAIEKDIANGGNGEVVFPLYRNLYGKTTSGVNFITDLQENLEQLGWVRLPHCPGTFIKRCKKTGQPMLIANYVDDFAAVLTKESREYEWNLLRKRWKFDEPKVSDRFLGVEIYYPDPNNKRKMVLHQAEYLNKVVQRYEEATKHTLPPSRVHLPLDEPDWPAEGEGTNSPTHVKSAIGGIAYAARGTRPDLIKAFHTLARRSTKWSDEGRKFLEAVLSYCKSHLKEGLLLDATGQSTSVADWQVDTSVDASHDVPWCQTGFFVTLTPREHTPGAMVPPFLPIDWVSNGQNYTKLAPAESETVALVQATRGGMKYRFSWDDVTASAEPIKMVVRVDNSQAQLYVERGWSPTMVHVPRVYGVNVLWITERLREGLLTVIHEEGKWMIADPLTKMRNSDQLMERKVMTPIPDVQVSAVLTEPNAGSPSP